MAVDQSKSRQALVPHQCFTSNAFVKFVTFILSPGSLSLVSAILFSSGQTHIQAPTLIIFCSRRSMSTDHFFLTPVSLCLQEEPRVQPSGSVLHNVHFHPGFFLLRRIIPSSGDWQANSTPVIFVKLQACGTCQHPPAVILRIILWHCNVPTAHRNPAPYPPNSLRASANCPTKSAMAVVVFVCHFPRQIRFASASSIETTTSSERFTMMLPFLIYSVAKQLRVW